MYNDRIYVNEERFAVRPSVVRSGVEAEIKITCLDAEIDFNDGDIFELRVVPKDYSLTYASKEHCLFGKEKCFDAQEVTVRDSTITFRYTFYGSQEWIVYLKNKKDDSATEWFWCDSLPKTRARLSVYCLTDDLYGTIPMKGDLHIHTTRSDGSQSPEYTVAAYREAGFDFLALTDHYKYNDAKALTEYFSFACPLQILPGEEVHDNSTLIHMVSIGATRGISEMLEKDIDYLESELDRIREEYKAPEGVYEDEYYLRIFVYEQIKKNGGYAIFPHPFWQLPERFVVDTTMSRAVLENRLADAFEVFGGCTSEGNDLQASLYYSIKGEPMPVVGSSDSHTVIGGPTAFDEIFTIALVKDSILNSISRRKSVAVFAVKGEKPRILGELECVKYAHFLLRCYFPKHNMLCKKSGELLKKYVGGDASLKDEIVAAERSVNDFTKEFFGL